MPNRDDWPGPRVTAPSKESEMEVKKIKEIVAASTETGDCFDLLLTKHSYLKTIRIIAWISRFVSGPLITLAEKVVQDAQEMTLHRGVGLTMALVHQKFWMPHLHQLARSTVTHCYVCKRFHTAAFHKPPPGNLPVERTEGSSLFQVIGVDYAGPIIVECPRGREGKHTFCSSHAVYREQFT